jgi:glycosyltransferase involved in cell wall biosynthesis
MQKPVVATSLSIEGLDLFDNKEVLLADSPSMFAEKVLYVMANNDEASRLGRNGLKRVQEHHSWAAMGMALETAMQSALAEANGSPR